ncbi:MAG: tetratricopeptide repeat protein, partial [Planctomycetes bacterium]|nr:tetratricopeptide repeat protein [Planctomycetota bacterium]
QEQEEEGKCGAAGAEEDAGRPSSDAVEIGRECLTHPGALLGTVPYMSPEQASGDRDAVDATADLWALGVILYETIAGRRPFVGNRASEVLAAIQKARPAAPSRGTRSCPPELSAIAIRCLAAEKKDRYPSARHFREDLERYLEGRPVSTARYTPFQRAAKWIGRHREASLAAGLAGALLLALVALGAWRLALRREEAELEREAAEQARRETEALLLAEERRREALVFLERGRGGVDHADRYLYSPKARREELVAMVGASLPFIRAGIERSPDLALGYHLLGRAHELLGSHDEADGAWTRAIQIDPDFAPARFHRARSLLSRAYLAALSYDGGKNRTYRDLVLRAAEELRAATARGKDWEDEIERLVAEGMLALFDETDPDAVRRIAEEGVRRFEGHPGEEEFYLLLGLSSSGKTRVEHLDRAVALRPTHLLARFVRAVERRHLGDPSGAIEDYGEILRFHSDFAAAYHNRAVVREMDLKDRKGAIEDYTRAIELDPARAANSLVGRANARREMGSLDEAIADYDEAIRLDPRIRSGHAGRSVARYRKGDFEGAMEDATKAIEIDPEDFHAFANRGNALRELGRLAESVQDHRRALEIEPRAVTALIGLGNALMDGGDHRGAVEAYDRALAADPDSALAHANRGGARELLEDLDGALADYTRALELDPLDAGTWANQGGVRLRKNDATGALPDFERAIVLDSRSWNAWLGKALALAALGRRDESRRAFDRASELAPPDGKEMVAAGRKGVLGE